jgi:opacity protein-like surface antigen
MALAMVVGLLVPETARAQDDWKEPGLWIEGGVGYGIANTDCARCSTQGHPAITFLAGIGGSASMKIRFGVEALGWKQSAADTAREYFGAMVLAQWYPVENVPFHIQGGIGGGRYAEEGGGDLLEASGFNLSLGTGYDYFFTRNFTVRAFLRYVWANGLSTKLNREPLFTDLNFNVLHFGLALTWQKM